MKKMKSIKCAVACSISRVQQTLRLSAATRYYLDEHLQKDQDAQNRAYKTNENGQYHGKFD